MLPNHNSCCIYFPTIVHGPLGKANSLNTEYAQSKKSGLAMVTKTAAKVTKALEAHSGRQKIDLVIVTHGSDDSSRVGGGSWQYTPVHEAADVAANLVSSIGAANLEKTNLWLWICYAGMNGAGAAFRQTIPGGTIRNIYAPTGTIAGIGLFLEHNNVPGSENFVPMA